MKARPPMYLTQSCSCCGAAAQVLNGAWLRSVREDEGESLRAMARRAKVSPAFLSDVERNRRAFSERLREAYGLPASTTHPAVQRGEVRA